MKLIFRFLTNIESNFFLMAVWRLHIRLALLATCTPTLLPRYSWVHKITGCWPRYCTFEVLWMGPFNWVCTYTLYLHHAFEERGRERTHSFCHRKHHVGSTLEQGIPHWGDCSRGSRFLAPCHEWSYISWNCIPNHGFPARQACKIILTGSIGICNICMYRSNGQSIWMDWRFS